jgi:hypothetical protein
MWLAGVLLGVSRRRVSVAAAGLDPGVRKGSWMAAMKPRTGDGPLEVTKEGRGIVMRVPLEGGGRLVVELTPDEARALSEALTSAVG